MAVNTAKMFEQTSRDAANPVHTAALGFSGIQLKMVNP